MGRNAWYAGAGLFAAAAVTVLVLGGQGRAQMSAEPTGAPPSAADADWPAWGNDLGGARYSRLTQITPENVGKLERAWIYQFDPVDLKPGSAAALEGTALKIRDTLYNCDSDNVVHALDAETGKGRWTFNTRTNTLGAGIAACRGVAYYRVPNASGDCAERIITNTLDARLFALDLRTGRPCAGFGQGGMVSLSAGVVNGDPLPMYKVTSAPLVAQGRIVVGGAPLDNQTVGSPSGVVRAFDAVTGQLVWAWDADRPEGAPLDTPYNRDTPNAWAPMSADEGLGLVYVPMGNTTPDHWGGNRSKGTEKYASALVALELATGKVRWSYQTVHHDLWDYDLPAQPTLVDLKRPEGVVPAVVQVTKHGQIFVLDRRTGAPVTKVVERPVPQGAAAGDYTSPTQPFSVGMPQFDGPPLTEKAMWGLTPFDQLFCRIAFRKLRHEGLMTPPSLKPTVNYPGNAGGFSWGGVSVDPVRQKLVGALIQVPYRMQLIPRAEADRQGMKIWDPARGVHVRSTPQLGTPFAAVIKTFASPLDVPCTAPPYGVLASVDLASGKLDWKKPLGTAQDSGPMGLRSGLPVTMGVPLQGGGLVTASGLVFIGATQERAFRAIDLNTGKVLWKDRLPTGAHANPMTYYSQQSGRQFVMVAVGGSTKLKNPDMGLFVAYALPKDTGKAQ